MIFHTNLLTCLAALGSLSSVLAAPASPDLDELDPRQLSLDEKYLFDSAFKGDGSASANESLRFRVYADEGPAPTAVPITIPTPTVTPLPPPRICTMAEQDECLRGNAPSPILCGYLAQALAQSSMVRIPGNGNSVCIAEVVRGTAVSYCCAHTSQKVAGLTYGDLLTPTIRLTNQCGAPRAEQGHIKRLTLVQRNACVNFCLDNKPTGCS
ncbi:hypothetical protein PG985_013958 [Apiospora marii]|uniref:uncharacterized protein n=1 Tax=Apiospora marii TaxID=335849 RepID=UPI0031329165